MTTKDTSEQMQGDIDDIYGVPDSKEDEGKNEEKDDEDSSNSDDREPDKD